MRNIIVFIFMFSVIPAFGQNHYIGLRGGINLSSIVSDNFLSESGSRIGLIGGLTYEYKFENKFNIGLDLCRL